MYRSRALFIPLVILVSLGPSNLPAQDTKAPAARPSMLALQVDTAPVVDGNVLDDPAWSPVPATSDFWQKQPQEGQPATQRTDVYIAYTSTAVYIGVVAYDDDPGGIIITDSRRDSSLDNTDAFVMVIDGLLDRQNGYVFGTNAAGVEYDGQVIKEGTGGTSNAGNAGFNLNWDGVWTVRSRVIEQGWSAEFEIPFSTLRYRTSGEQAWGINFQRNIRRNNEIVFWAALGRNRNLYRVSEAGTLTGISPPPVRNLQVTPYVLGLTRRGGQLAGSETSSEFGIDVKYGITPSLTLDLTLNTDFAQVEADDQQINLDRFALFFPEKRPFFLENAGQFFVGNNEEIELFFSRRIGIGEDGALIPVEGGARVTGKVGETTNIGLLYMQTDAVTGVAPANQFAVARVSQELPNRSAIGAMFVSRDGDGSYLTPANEDYNRTYAVDGRWGIGEDTLLEAWAARTETPGLTGRDDAYSVKADYDSETWWLNAAYTDVGENFNPEVGFLARSNYRKASATVLKRILPRDLWGLYEIRPHISYRGYWKPDGYQETELVHFAVQWEFQTSSELHTAYNLTRAGVIDSFEIVPGVIVPPGTYDHRELSVYFVSDQSKPFSFSLRTIVGGRFGGDRFSVLPTVSYRIGESFRADLEADFNDYDLPVPGGKFTANLARLRLSYSFTPSIQIQGLTQYNETTRVLGTNLRFSWLRTANSGLHLVYNEVDERNQDSFSPGRELIVKYSYIFDVLR